MFADVAVIVPLMNDDERRHLTCKTQLIPRNRLHESTTGDMISRENNFHSIKGYAKYMTMMRRQKRSFLKSSPLDVIVVFEEEIPFIAC